MDVFAHLSGHRGTNEPRADDHISGTGEQAMHGRTAVRARLNGMPCLISVLDTDAEVVSGALAIPPIAGERAPLPPKGQRATLELVESDPRDCDPIEIMVSASNRRTGRFTAQVLALSEDQAECLRP
jgi:hypothetical protein